MVSRYVLGAVETFLKAVPAAGIFRGKNYDLFHKYSSTYAMLVLFLAEIWKSTK